MLDDLGHGVDRTDSKLSNAMRRMRKFVRDTEGQFPCHLSVAWVLNIRQKVNRDGA
jgi:hypothetical protein